MPIDIWILILANAYMYWIKDEFIFKVYTPRIKNFEQVRILFLW